MQVCTLLQTDKHASTPPLSFLQAGCPSCRPTNSVKALKALKKNDPIIGEKKSAASHAVGDLFAVAVGAKLNNIASS